MTGHWLAWRWYTSRGTPGKWSLNHFVGADGRTARCGVVKPGTGRIFDCNGGTGQDRCKRCEKLIRETGDGSAADV